MIKSAATAIEPARDNAAPVQPLYLEALTLAALTTGSAEAW